MSSPPASSHNDLTASDMTIRSDSEAYPSHDSPSSPTSEQPSSSSTPLILYQPPSLWGLLRGAAINLLLPFVNGLMLGFGELFAHEAAYRLGWAQTKVFPSGRSRRPMGPGIEVRDDPIERRRRGEGMLDDMTSLE